MVKTCKGVQAQWSTEFFKFVVSAVRSVATLAAASRTHGTPRRTRLIERDILTRNFDEIQSYLRMLENKSAKESRVWKKLVLDLHEITFAGFLFKYARNKAYRIHGMGECWGKFDLLAF